MLKCPECDTNYPHGTIVCMNDGHEFVQTEESRQLMRSIGHGAVTVPAIVMRIEMVDGMSFRDPVPVIVITHARLRGGPPIRIGRRDNRSNPPIFPEIDFHNFFVGSDGAPCISRLHAVIEMQDGSVCLRSISLVPTFIRRTGESSAVALTARQYHKFAHNDTIYLADPKRRHVRLRVLMA